MILRSYRAAGRLFTPFAPILLKQRQMAGKEDAVRLSERTGHPSQPRPEGSLVWIHGASVGESQSVLRLIRRLLDENPGLSVLVTTGTVTSANLLHERLPARAIHQYVPLDLPGATARFIRHWRPDLAIWVESELWPNLIGEMAATGKPMAILNGRMSERSFNRWRRFPATAERVLASFSLVLAQNDEADDRFLRLGAPAVETLGNLKYAADLLPVDDDALATLATQIGQRPHWLAASIHPGEDIAIAPALSGLSAAHPRLLTIIVPRHPARAEEMAAEFMHHGLGVAFRSRGEPITAGTDIYLADTMGELGLFYSLPGPVFVGGSLVRHGGQNVLEPARFGRCLLTGPYSWNFSDVIADLRREEALIEVESGEELGLSVSRMLSHADEQVRLGSLAEIVATRQSAVLDRVLMRLAPLLPSQ